MEPAPKNKMSLSDNTNDDCGPKMASILGMRNVKQPKPGELGDEQNTKRERPYEPGHHDGGGRHDDR
jgi:hypothetical protein